jgi:hypothetical protein
MTEDRGQRTIDERLAGTPFDPGQDGPVVPVDEIRVTNDERLFYYWAEKYHLSGIKC